MLKQKITFVYLLFILLSCNRVGKSDFFTISIESKNENQLLLSEIVDNVEVIELELTEQSLISRITRVLDTDDYIIVCYRNYIMMFDRKTGKFVRRVSSVGQGPGEFAGIIDITTDNIGQKIYIITRVGKIMCYDFEGNFIKESPGGYYRGFTRYLNYVNDELLYLSEDAAIDQDGTRINQILLYYIDHDLLISDSIKIHRIKSNMIGGHHLNDFITVDKGSVYLYYSDLLPDTFVPDTLYLLKNKQLVPHLNLSFKNRGFSIAGEKNIFIHNIYRSSRYVFAMCKYDRLNSPLYCFCYDTKSGKSYNMRDGYTDDIHTGEKVIIRPFDSDANKFYYLHTNMDDSDKDEPNPTLYIGTLKK